MNGRRMAIAWLTVLCLGGAWTGLALAQPVETDEPKTLKERLSDKPSDEQRVDNCNVPTARRGATPRPDCDMQSDAKLMPTPPR
jgi:hypothetical protein